MTFKEGGAFDLANTFERIKDALAQMVDVARESGHSGRAELSEVNLEQLPAYEEVGNTRQGAGPLIHQPVPMSPVAASRTTQRDSGIVVSSDDEQNSKPTSIATSSEQAPLPNGPPPGYEEVQHNSIVDTLEENARNPH